MKRIIAVFILAIVIICCSSAAAFADSYILNAKGAHAQAEVGNIAVYVRVWEGLEKTAAGISSKTAYLQCNTYDVETKTILKSYYGQIEDGDFNVAPNLSSASLNVVLDIGEINLAWNAEGRLTPWGLPPLKKPFDPYVIMIGKYLSRPLCFVQGSVFGLPISEDNAYGAFVYSTHETKAWPGETK